MATTTQRPAQPTEGAFRVDLHPEREVIRVAAIGALDPAGARVLTDQLYELRAVGFTRIVLDLREVEHCDPTVIARIVADDRAANGPGCDLSLIGSGDRDRALRRGRSHAD